MCLKIHSYVNNRNIYLHNILIENLFTKLKIHLYIEVDERLKSLKTSENKIIININHEQKSIRLKPSS